MIEFPREEAFDLEFKRGAIFFCKNYDFSGGKSKDKYLLVLNGADNENYSHFYLPTSQTDKYKNNPMYANSILLIPISDDLPFIKETAIIIRRPQRKNREYFKRRYLNPSDSEYLKFCAMMPSTILDEIYKKIIASREISLDIKKKILPSKHLAPE